MNVVVAPQRTIRFQGTGMVHPDGAMGSIDLRPGSKYSTFPIVSCPGKLSADCVPASRLRRMGRFHKLAVISAYQAVLDAGIDEQRQHNMAVMVGSGLACTSDTEEFLENMIERDEAEPKPGCFINSVHNAAGSQIAINLSCVGENLTFSNNFISFELTCWQAIQVLQSDRADAVCVCGVEEVSPYLIAAGLEFDWWAPPDSTAAILQEPRSLGTLPGEGAAAALLTCDDQSTGPRLESLALGSLPDHRPQSLSTEQGMAFVEKALSAADSSLDDLDLIVIGADGIESLDAAHARVVAGCNDKAGRTIPTVRYKHLCGEFCTAAAIGTVLSARVLDDRCNDPGGRFLPGDMDRASVSTILVYHVYPTGYQTAMVILR